MIDTQNEAILNHLKNIGPLTPLDALRLYGCFRLGARCWDLRHQGHDIKTTMVEQNGKRFAQYSLNEPVLITAKNGQMEMATL